MVASKVITETMWINDNQEIIGLTHCFKSLEDFEEKAKAFHLETMGEQIEIDSTTKGTFFFHEAKESLESLFFYPIEKVPFTVAEVYVLEYTANGE